MEQAAEEAKPPGNVDRRKKRQKPKGGQSECWDRVGGESGDDQEVECQGKPRH